MKAQPFFCHELFHLLTYYGFSDCRDTLQGHWRRRKISFRESWAETPCPISPQHKCELFSLVFSINSAICYHSTRGKQEQSIFMINKDVHIKISFRVIISPIYIYYIYIYVTVVKLINKYFKIVNTIQTNSQPISTDSLIVKEWQWKGIPLT